MVYLYFLVGLVLIIKGGDAFVDAAGFIGEKTGIPKFIIGATIVSVATTLPELLVSLLATIHGSNAIAVGNAVGSVSCNIALVMGVSILCMPAYVRRAELTEKGFLMILSGALLFASALNGNLSVAESCGLIAVFFFFLYINVKITAETGLPMVKAGDSYADKKEMRRNTLKFILGAAAIALGAAVLVENGQTIARQLAVPEHVIGLTMIAIGTSLPELVTTITAIRKKESAISIGNILGANIIDLTLILPICSLISGGGLAISRQSVDVDMLVMLAFMVVAVVPALLKGKFSRWQSGALLVGYASYLCYLC